MSVSSNLYLHEVAAGVFIRAVMHFLDFQVYPATK